MYTYISSVLHLRPTPYPIPVTEHQAELPALHSNFPLAVCLTHGSVYLSILLSQIHPTLSSRYVHESILNLCLSIPVLQICLSVPFS